MSFENTTVSYLKKVLRDLHLALAWSGKDNHPSSVELHIRVAIREVHDAIASSREEASACSGSDA
jgi:hypothetical protein